MADSLDRTEPQVDDDLTLVRGQFEEFAEETIASRAQSEKCRDYRDGKQWTDDEVATLKARGQPAITDNKIQDKCDTLLGIEKQMRTDPKAYPRNPGDEDSADAATDALRFVADQSEFNRSVRKPAADNLMVEGLCAGQVIIEKRSGKYGKQAKVCMQHIRWDRVYYDIHSLKENFEDKDYCGFFTWMDFSVAERDFDPKRNKRADKEALDHLEASWSKASPAGPDSTHDDKPRFTMTSRGRKRVQVFEHYFKKDGVWHFGKWCYGGWLEPAKPSTYKDEYGEPVCCIEIQALYRDRDANAYGSVPRYLDMQDEHNKRRSKMLHLLSAKRMIASKGAFDNIADARRELHKPDGVLEPNPGFEVDVQDNVNLAEGQWRLLVQSDQALSQTGPNSALSGQSGDLSGRAKQLDQQSGALPISPLFDALDAWELRMYRSAWCRIKQYWTTETWVRVTDDEQKPKFVGLNQPVLMGDQFAEQLKAEQMPLEKKQQLIQMAAADPQSRQPAIGPDGKAMIKNNVAEMDVDIIIDRGPDVVTLQQEQFGVLSELAKSRPEIPFELLIEASSLRSDTKKRILDKMSGKDDPMRQQMAQLEQTMQGLAVALQEANVRKVNAEAAKSEAATVESHIDAAIKTDSATDPKTEVSVN